MEFTAYNTRNWNDMLPELLKQYNESVHSCTRLSPKDASKKKNEKLLLNDYSATIKHAKFKLVIRLEY